MITHIILPLFLIGWAISLHKNYSLKNFLNIFFVSFLVSIPTIHFIMQGFASMGRQEITFEVFLKLLIPSAIIAIFAGLIGLILNSVYILVLRILKKA